MSAAFVLMLAALAAASAGREQGPGPQPGRDDSPPTEVRLGETVRGELSGGQTASYTIELERDQFLFARVLQLSVDLVVAVRDPDGHLLAEIDALPDGPEFISLRSDSRGSYRVDLRPFDPLASPGAYLVQLLKQRPAAHDQRGKVDELFAELDQTWMPGAAVVVLQDGEIVHTNAFGMADLEDEVALTTTTPINICSIGKQLTAFAIALLADRGELGLEDDIRDHLPWMPDFGHRITVSHLIHHTSGLRELDDLTSMADRAGLPLRRSGFRWYVERQRELSFLPGEQYLYCNTGYVLLGEIIEAVTGSPFIDWMEANVLAPLGMRNTSFYHDVEALPEGFAWSYRLGPDGGFRRYEMVPAWYVAAGNVFSTAEDMGRWLLHLDDPWICSRRVIEQMGQGGELVNGDSTDYAFAQMRQDYRGIVGLEHGGGGWGYQSYIMRFPEQRFATLVVSNFVYGRAFTRARKIADLFLAEHLIENKPDDEYVNRRQVAAIDSHLLDTYTGTFEQPSGAITTVAREGQRLAAQIAGLNEVSLYPAGEGAFFAKESDLRVVFVTGRHESAEELTVLTPADTVTYVRASEASVSGQSLAEYEGGYSNDELDVRYDVAGNGRQIWVRLPRGTMMPCTLVQDELFRCPYCTLKFDRDDQSRVIGFRLDSDRSLNVRFRKN